jgi:SAM-dependent methyltransferase
MSTITRLTKNLLFDLTHIDMEIAVTYAEFLQKTIFEKTLRKPALASEVYNWRRMYHSLHAQGLPVSGRQKQVICKQSIQFTLEMLNSTFGKKLKVIEVGCGPTTQFYASNLEQYDLDVVTVDPLATVYNELHRRYRSGYPFRCLEGTGEILCNMFPECSFHFVYSQNAIDHSVNPLTFVRNLCKILKVGGFLVLHGFVNEGSNAHWLGLHKWNISVKKGALALSNRSGSINEVPLVDKLPVTTELVAVENGAFTFAYKKYSR